MGLRAPMPPQPGRIYHLQRPVKRPVSKWRQRAHAVLIDAMMLAGIAAIAYGFVIHPILRHLH